MTTYTLERVTATTQKVLRDGEVIGYASRRAPGHWYARKPNSHLALEPVTFLSPRGVLAYFRDRDAAENG